MKLSRNVGIDSDAILIDKKGVKFKVEFGDSLAIEDDNLDADALQLITRCIRNRLQKGFKNWTRLGDLFILNRTSCISLQITISDSQLSIIPALIESPFESILYSTKIGTVDGYLAPNGVRAIVFCTGIQSSHYRVQVDNLQFMYPSNLIFKRKQDSVEMNDALNLLSINDLSSNKTSKLVKPNDEMIDEDEDLVIKKTNLPTPITYCNIFSPQYFASTYSPSPMGEVISPLYSPGVGIEFKTSPPTSPFNNRNQNGAPNIIAGTDEVEFNIKKLELPPQWQPIDIDVACLSDSTYGSDGYNYSPSESPQRFTMKTKLVKGSGDQFISNVEAHYLESMFSGHDLRFAIQNVDFGPSLLKCPPWLAEVKIRLQYHKQLLKLKREKLSDPLFSEIKQNLESVFGNFEQMSLKDFEVEGSYC